VENASEHGARPLHVRRVGVGVQRPSDKASRSLQVWLGEHAVRVQRVSGSAWLLRYLPGRVTDENILRRIRGDDVARALAELPPCDATAATELDAVIEVPELGRVRFTFARFEHRRGKLRREFWTVERAVRVE
jgi:hypothetical protein